MKLVKVRRIWKASNNYVVTIPPRWLKELDWFEKNIVLEYHPYHKEILITEDFRNIFVYKKRKRFFDKDENEPEIKTLPKVEI